MNLKINKSVIAMLHVGALPGTPRNSAEISEIISVALKEAIIFADHGVDAIMIENMHDRPYLNRSIGPEIVASMAVIAGELKGALKIPVGIQILAGANKEALAVAKACGLDFIRAEGFVFGHVADEGWVNSDAGDLLRYRKLIGAEHIRIYTDIKKKHSSHAVTGDISIYQAAKAAEFFLSDGVIITGTTTGEKPSLEEIKIVKKTVNIPVITGSGIDAENISEYWDFADAFIIGSSLKKDGNWENEVCSHRVGHLMKRVNSLRK